MKDLNGTRKRQTLKQQILQIASTHSNHIKLDGKPIIEYLVTNNGGLSFDDVAGDFEWLIEFDNLNQMDVPVGSAAKLTDAYIFAERAKYRDPKPA